MRSYYQLTAELYTPHVVPVINAKQYDSGRGVDITLTDCGAVVVPAASDVCNLYCKKLDGTVSYLSGTVNGSAVRVDFTNTLLADAGVVECELEVTSGADTVSTPVFRMVVLPSNYDQSAIESQDEFTALETALQTVSQYDARIEALETTDTETQLFIANKPGVTVNACKVGKVIFVYFYTDSIVQMPAGGEVNLFTALDGAKPPFAARFVCFNNAAASASELCMNGRMTTAGNFFIYSYTANTRPYGMVTYIAS